MVGTDILEGGLLKVNEAAEVLSLSRGTVYNEMASGRLAYVKVRGSRRIPRTVLQRYVETRMVRTVDPISTEAV